MRFFLFLILVVIFQGCSVKEPINTTKYELNFINKTDKNITDITIYSSKTNKKLYFNYLVKNATNTYYLFKRIRQNNQIEISWKENSQVFTYKFNTKDLKKSPIININFLPHGKYNISFI